MKVFIFLYSVFHNDGNGGNPAGVVFSKDSFTKEQMLKISKKMNISEVVFISLDQKAEYTLRYFTPNQEIEYCGHATLAAYFHLFKNKYINAGTYDVKTMSGDIKVIVEEDGHVISSQQNPIFGEIISIESIKNIFSLPHDAYDISKFQPKIISTGVKDIFVPIRSIKYLKNINPNYTLMSEYNKKLDTVGFHLFTLDTIEPNSTAFCRNFAPLYGINEESATGSSSGALGCYFAAQEKGINKHSYLFEQGDYMNMSSRISVNVRKTNGIINEVNVGGYISYIKKNEFEL